MNFQAILVANLTGFVLILFLAVSRRISRRKKDTEESAFVWMTRLVLIACLVEPLTFAVDGIHSPVAYWINMLGNTYLYYANGIGAFLWIMYIDLKMFHDRSRLKRIYYKLSVPVSLMLLALLFNLRFHYFFYVDADYVYHRQPAINAFYIYLVLCAIYSIGLYVYHKRVHGATAFFPIFMYLVPIVSCSLLQMIFYGISLAWLGTAVGLIALAMSVQQQEIFLDQMTGLYNRMYLEHALYKISCAGKDNHYGLMLDMNYFKQINDTYGHSAGDQALKDVAKILLQATPEDAVVFRYAGDEFIILLQTAQEADAIALKDKLLHAAEKFNCMRSRPYDISYAIGYSKYESDFDNSDRFLKKIDEAMYADKRRYHEG